MPFLRNKKELGLLISLLSALGVGPVLVFGLSAVSDLIISDLGISEAQFGLVATVCFGVGAFGNILLARFADRHRDTILFTVIFGFSAVGLLIASIHGNYALLLVAAAMAGIAQSFPNGVTNRVIVQRVPEAKRIRWTGVKQSGVQIYQLISSLAFPLMVVSLGWRGASLAAALCVSAVGFFSLRAIKIYPSLHGHDDVKQQIKTAELQKSEGPKRRYRTLVVMLAVFGFFNGIGVQATNVYAALFAVRELNFPLFIGGATAAVAGIVGVAARLAWSALMARGFSAQRLLIVLASLATSGGLTFVASHTIHSAPLMWLAVSLHGIAALGVSVVLMAALLRAIPATRMGSASGIVSAGQYGGFTVGPLIVGGLIGTDGGFFIAWLAVTLAYLICVAIGIFMVKTTK
ncbi:MFS transporter [Glutamicibacter mysorens]|uniref:MFS transporter n=1 Tax=Glutamicibacter mysorens TaxID=257984 RepID=UPI0020C67D88|nr:MFS transporter [Glutamicibacter mysorens]UTM45829.1 MFS transporter [Glutamicibacter mysorens]